MLFNYLYTAAFIVTALMGMTIGTLYITGHHKPWSKLNATFRHTADAVTTVAAITAATTAALSFSTSLPANTFWPVLFFYSAAMLNTSVYIIVSIDRWKLDQRITKLIKS